MATIISGLDIVIAHALGTGTSLYTLVGTRIAKRLLPDSFKNAQAAICVHPESATTPINAGIVTDTYVFKCYGGTDDPDDAAAVFRAVYARFQDARATNASGSIVQSELVMTSDMVDPETGWPVYIGKFKITTA